MSESAVTTSKGRGGRGKKTKDDVEEVEKAQEPEPIINKKGANKRKIAGKKEEEPAVEENGQTEPSVIAVPPKKAGRGAKGKAAKTVDDVEELGDGDNDGPLETQPPKRISRTRKEVVYKEVDEDIDNKKKRGAAKAEARPAVSKKNDKKLTKSKPAIVKTKKKVESEEEDEDEEEEPQKNSGDEEIEEADDEKEDAAVPEKTVDDEDGDEELAEEEVPPTKKARGGRAKPTTKKDSDKTTAVIEKSSSRKRGGKKTEEVSAVKDVKAEDKTKKRKQPKVEKKQVNIEVNDQLNNERSVIIAENIKEVAKSNTLTEGNVDVGRGKPSSRSNRKQNVKKESDENEINQNVTMRKGKTTSKRKKPLDEIVKEEESTEVKQIKPYELVSIDKEYSLKISTWNVAGIRAWFAKGGLEFIKRENPDIICLQETKCLEEDMPEVAKIVGYHPYYLCKTGGYAGVAMYSKKMPMKIDYGIGDSGFDEEGRIMTAEFEKFFLICVYIPNSGRKLVNLEKRMKWNKLFLEFVRNKDKTLSKPVIICGDMNVSHLEIDLANPKTNKRSPGFTQEERDDLTELLNQGFVDTFRYLYPDKKDCYTYWTYMSNARARNVGWRLDYFIVSQRMISRIVDNVIRSEVYGSDHCPITLFLNMNTPLIIN